MKCKNCGAPLNLNVKFCPNCGTPNEEAAKHIKDMENYGRKFNQTRNRVVGNSKWFVEYIAPLTSMAIAVVIFAVSWVASADGFGYTLADAANSSYNRRHKTQIQSKMNEYIDSGKYEEAYFANSRREWQPDFDDERGWDSFIRLCMTITGCADASRRILIRHRIMNTWRRMYIQEPQRQFIIFSMSMNALTGLHTVFRHKNVGKPWKISYQIRSFF